MENITTAEAVKKFNDLQYSNKRIYNLIKKYEIEKLGGRITKYKNKRLFELYSLYSITPLFKDWK